MRLAFVAHCQHQAHAHPQPPPPPHTLKTAPTGAAGVGAAAEAAAAVAAAAEVAEEAALVAQYACFLRDAFALRDCEDDEVRGGDIYTGRVQTTGGVRSGTSHPPFAGVFLRLISLSSLAPLCLRLSSVH